jgi:uncharacterized repeat protein (TIGR01451 family)
VTVQLAKKASNLNPSSGDVVTYTIIAQVSNNQSQDSILWDTVPANLTYVGNATPVATVQALPTPGSTATGTLLSWNLGTVLPGQYVFQYQASVNQLVQGGSEVMNQANWIDFEHPTPVVASAPITIAGEYQVKINVYNESGEVVKHILIATYSQPLNNVDIQINNLISTLNGKIDIYYKGILIGSWNGTNDQNQPVTNGQYYVEIANIDPYGSVTTETKDVTVDRLVQTLNVLIYNEAGEVVRHLYQQATNYSLQNEVVQMIVSSNTLNPNYSINTPTIQIQWSNSSGNKIGSTIWNGRNDSGTIVTNGQYFIEITSNTTNGAEEVVTQEVTVLSNGPTTGSIYAAPNILNHGQTKLVLKVSPPLGAGNWTLSQVRLYDVDGELVAHFSGSPNTNSASYNVAGLASGLYFAVVSLKDAQGDQLGRQVVKVVLLH